MEEVDTREYIMIIVEGLLENMKIHHFATSVLLGIIAILLFGFLVRHKYQKVTLQQEIGRNISAQSVRKQQETKCETITERQVKVKFLNSDFGIQKQQTMQTRIDNNKLQEDIGRNEIEIPKKQQTVQTRMDNNNMQTRMHNNNTTAKRNNNGSYVIGTFKTIPQQTQTKQQITFYLISGYLFQQSILRTADQPNRTAKRNNNGRYVIGSFKTLPQQTHTKQQIKQDSKVDIHSPKRYCEECANNNLASRHWPHECWERKSRISKE